MATGFGRASAAGVERLGRVGGADHLSDLLVFLQERDQLAPGLVPQANCRTEAVAHLSARSSNAARAWRRFEFVPVHAGRQPERVADQVDDAYSRFTAGRASMATAPADDRGSTRCRAACATAPARSRSTPSATTAAMPGWSAANSRASVESRRASGCMHADSATAARPSRIPRCARRPSPPPVRRLPRRGSCSWNRNPHGDPPDSGRRRRWRCHGMEYRRLAPVATAQTTVG